MAIAVGSMIDAADDPVESDAALRYTVKTEPLLVTAIWCRVLSKQVIVHTQAKTKPQLNK